MSKKNSNNNHGENENRLERIKNIVEIGVLVVTLAITIFTSHIAYQTKISAENERFSNRMELASELIFDYITLTEYASKSLCYLGGGIDNANEDYLELHSEKIEQLKKNILAYGSEELVCLFFDSYNNLIDNFERGNMDFESNQEYFFAMPLIAAYIKYDLTGELVNPSYFYESLMVELNKAKKPVDFDEKMRQMNNKLVEEYNLPKELKWKNVDKVYNE